VVVRLPKAAREAAMTTALDQRAPKEAKAAAMIAVIPREATEIAAQCTVRSTAQCTVQSTAQCTSQPTVQCSHLIALQLLVQHLLILLQSIIHDRPLLEQGMTTTVRVQRCVLLLFCK
jgi:hypothetical protein